MQRADFAEHCETLRMHIFACIGVLLFFLTLVFFSQNICYDFVLAQAPKLYFIAVYEPFVVRCKIVVFFAALCAFPIVAEIGRRYLHEMIKVSWLFSVYAAVACMVSVAAVQFFLIRNAVMFFVSMAGQTVPMLGLDSYVSLWIFLFFMVASAMLLPVVFWIVFVTFDVSPDRLRSQRAVALVSAFVIAAVVTPPDVFSQSIVGIILYGSYEAMIIALSFRRTSIRGR
jgi:sec-independent protein translocase protein TatC